MKNSFLNINEVFLILTIVESIFLSILLKVLPSKHQQPRNILAFFFVLISGMLLTTIIIWNGYLQTLPIAHSTLVPLILSCCLLLQGPVLYLYLRSLSQPIKLWRWMNALHLLPSVIVSTVILVVGIDVIDWLPWTPLSPRDQAAVKFVWAIFKCLPLLYVIACVYAEYRLRQELQHVYSTISAKELRLADLVLMGFFIQSFWSIAAYFLSGYISGEMNDLLGVLNTYLTVMLVNMLFAFGIINTRQQLNVRPAETTKLVDITKTDEKIAAIERGLHEQKLYLDSQINLDRFSEQINVKSRDVSVIINSHYQSNFFEFINGFRVEEAKRLLVAPENQEDTILDIIYKSGFNSQSAFHRFFKRIVGITPSEYRKMTLKLNAKMEK
jgi:AraC-like DNA-binding protein